MKTDKARGGDLVEYASYSVRPYTYVSYMRQAVVSQCNDDGTVDLHVFTLTHTDCQTPEGEPRFPVAIVRNVQFDAEGHVGTWRLRQEGL